MSDSGQQLPDLSRIFAADGSLAAAVPGFRARGQQLEMAQAILEAIVGHRVLVAEAGTGTGKTFAYLAPALLSGGKTIISTGTRTLQDQLFTRDLPTVRDALKLPVTTALLKGRVNYVCPYHLERNRRDGRFLTAQDAADLRAIARFAPVTPSGDRSACTNVREDSGAWLAATSTRENCLGQDCPDVKKCFVLQARRAAMEADVVIVNHHLFFADVMLKDEGMGELLPGCNTIIFDEAHQLPETASLFFGESVSTSQVLELARDTRSETIAAARDCVALIDETRALEKATRDFRLAFDLEPVKLSAAQAMRREDFAPQLAAFVGVLARFDVLLETQAERSEGLANCLHRTRELAARFEHWRNPGDADGMIRWVEVFTHIVTLNATPLDVASLFRRQLNSGPPRAWVFTSATLAIGTDLGHYCREIGVTGLEPSPLTGVWGSPFDYGEQALLYAPTGMPNPNSPLYTEAVVEAALPLIRAARGRAFVLCTSLKAMRRIHELLAEGLQQNGSQDEEPLPLLLQGEGSRTELLERFRRLGNAVLVASQSFWEGVDVPGDALSVVIIDKLPFAPPDDPVFAARVEHMEKQGINPFLYHQLPRAVISMKQGAGRLIRSEYDHGLLCVCDPRMVNKSYGKAVWRSLPPMRRTREESVAVAFLGQLPH
ncbi:MAG: ATP-dependent DNA helicase [Betaproteobacteria bacterium]|nr:ATP-dependent DNA helicase [Betaproteobacteria bacterium]